VPVIRKYALTQEESGIYRALQGLNYLPTSLIRCSIIKTRAKKANPPLRVSRHGVAEGILKEPYAKGESVRKIYSPRRPRRIRGESFVDLYPRWRGLEAPS